MKNNGLVVDKISVFYDNGKIKTLKDLSFRAEAGTVSVIIGPSGSGKSTLLRALAGIEKKSSGEIYLNDEILSPKKQKIGFVPQNYGLFPWCTVEENIMLGIKMKKKITSNIISKMNNLMENLGILNFKNQYPLELSGGQQQRVSLARAFLLETDILLMDEPFSALDAITREDVQNVFATLWKEYKLLTILVTHDVDEALYLGNHIIILQKNGQILEILYNPFWGEREQTDSKDFIEMRKKLRKLLKKSGDK